MAHALYHNYIEQVDLIERQILAVRGAMKHDTFSLNDDEAKRILEELRRRLETQIHLLNLSIGSLPRK